MSENENRRIATRSVISDYRRNQKYWSMIVGNDKPHERSTFKKKKIFLLETATFSDNSNEIILILILFHIDRHCNILRITDIVPGHCKKGKASWRISNCLFVLQNIIFSYGRMEKQFEVLDEHHQCL